MLNIEENCSHRRHEIKNESLTQEKMGCPEKKASAENKNPESEIGHHDTLSGARVKESRNSHHKNKMKNSTKTQHEKRMAENSVNHFSYRTQFKIFFDRESEKFAWKFFIQIIKRAMMNGMVSGPGLIRCETQESEEAADFSFPFLIRVKTLMSAIMGNGENPDPEKGRE